MKETFKPYNLTLNWDACNNETKGFVTKKYTLQHKGYKNLNVSTFYRKVFSEMFVVF